MRARAAAEFQQRSGQRWTPSFGQVFYPYLLRDLPITRPNHAWCNLQKAFAALVLYSLYKDMFRRGIQPRITHAVVFDEAHRAAGLKLIPTMAKECRKYGISLVVASQEAKDFNVSLFFAIANYLVLRLTPILFYLYAEPEHWPAHRKPVDERAKARHREELQQFAATVAGDDTLFLPCPYRRLLDAWTNSKNGDIRAHAHAVDARFSP